MWTKLVDLDRYISWQINNCGSEAWDGLMIFFSGRSNWIPLYVLLIATIVYIYRKKSLWIILGVLLLIALADFSSVHLFKNTVCRLRPCHEPSLDAMLRLPNGCGGKYGFVSSHAVNHFAIAVYMSYFLSLAYKKLKAGKQLAVGAAQTFRSAEQSVVIAAQTGAMPTANPKFTAFFKAYLGLFRYGILYFWAVAIVYSRVYLAAHYLGDVVCGALWGSLLAIVFIWLSRKLVR